MKNAILIFSLTVFIYSCTGQNNNTDHVTIKQDSVATKKAIAIDTVNNNLARFIAGLKNESGNNFTELEKKSEWVNYKNLFDSSWTALENKRLNLMKQWAGTELASANKSSQNVFYPFSGPDFLNIYNFFPNGKTYTFIGLEPVGDVADMKSLSDKNLNSYLASIYNSLNDLFKRSYFITKTMVKDMHNNEITGALPILYVFLERTNNKIVSVRYIAVNQGGSVIDYDRVTMKNDSILKKSRGVEIKFLPSDTGSVRTLYYFSVNLADDKIAKNPGFVKYLDNLGTVTTYVKSASYLMHYLTFSTIRNVVLNHSAYLLQDDSGIAYRFFDKKEWNIKLYGNYAMPINDFRSQFEKDLYQAYKNDSTIQKIPFSLGYNWSGGGVNLMFASKKEEFKKE